MGAEFCVLCGRSDVAIADGLCPDCYVKNNPLVRSKERPTVVICPTCGSRRIGQHWEGAGSSTLLTPEDLAPFLEPHEEVGIRKVVWTETGSNPLQRELEGAVLVRFRGTERTVLVKLIVKVDHRNCEDCSRRTGHYYTAVIQLRSEPGPPKESARELRERLAGLWDRAIPQARAEMRKALSWREELPEGWDFYLSETIAARGLARLMKTKIGGTLKESATLYGRKDGRDVYRVTLCLRVPRTAMASVPARSRQGTDRRDTDSAPSRQGHRAADSGLSSNGMLKR
ncbi:MAG: 60S ribosomal export protein NMD3 [Thermoplasmata archaeon]|nr:60S ribosomal export protein NMD3 [Thermoplasmata archaeon]